MSWEHDEDVQQSLVSALVDRLPMEGQLEI